MEDLSIKRAEGMLKGEETSKKIPVNESVEKIENIKNKKVCEEAEKSYGKLKERLKEKKKDEECEEKEVKKINPEHLGQNIDIKV